MATGAILTKALRQRGEVRQRAQEDRAKRIRAAVENYLDGTCSSLKDAAAGQGVPHNAVQAAVQAEKACRAQKEVAG